MTPTAHTSAHTPRRSGNGEQREQRERRHLCLQRTHGGRVRVALEHLWRDVAERAKHRSRGGIALQFHRGSKVDECHLHRLCLVSQQQVLCATVGKQVVVRERER